MADIDDLLAGDSDEEISTSPPRSLSPRPRPPSPRPAPAPQEEERFPCTVCGAVFAGLPEYRLHRVEGHRKERCYVAECNAAFETREELGDHLRREHQVLETMEMDGGVAVHLTTARSQENLDIARWAGEWIGSSMATSHMVRVMAARTRSRRHLLFLDRRERERCSGAGTSRLYQLSNPGFLGGGGETDTAVIKHLTERVFLPNLEAADPELREIYARDDKCGFVYATCVLFPETFIHQHQVWSGPPGTSCCNHLRRCRARPGRRPRWPSWRWPWTPRRGWVLLVMW